MDWIVRSLMLPSAMVPVEGLIGSCPETNTNPLADIPCEYGPIAAGAFLVDTQLIFSPFE